MFFKITEGRGFRLESGVPTVGHVSGVSTPHKLQLSYLVFKYAEGREFRRESGVPTAESSRMCREFRHLTLHCNLVTVGAV